MSKTIDTKVVEMQFDNAEFEKGVKESMSTLDKLKEKLKGMNSSEVGLEELSKSAKKVDLASLSDSVDQLSSRFSAMGIVGMTVLANLTNSAVNTAKKIITAIPNQIMQGGWTRAMNLENAKFQLEGLGYTWDKVGKQISNSVNGTAYSLDSAAKAAGSLVASGIKIEGEGDKLEKALTAISGVAAQTNSDFDSIASIFTTVAGNGKLMTMQLQQLSNRGLNAAATLGKVLGKSEADIRAMVTAGKIDFETFSSAMLEAFGEHAYKANETFTGSLANMKAALSKIGSNFADPIIQNAVPIFNALRESINGSKVEVEQFFAKFDLAQQTQLKANVGAAQAAIDKLTDSYKKGAITEEEYDSKLKELNDDLTFAKRKYMEAMSPFEKFITLARNFTVNVIKGVDWSFLEGIFKTTIHLGKGLYSVIAPIHDAFKQTFTGSIWEALDKITQRMALLTSKIVLSKTAMSDLRDTFKGVFDVVHAVGIVFNEFLKVVIPTELHGRTLVETILNVTGTIGRFLSKVSDMTTRTDEVRVAFEKWAVQLKIVAGLLVALKFRNQIANILQMVSAVGLLSGKLALIAGVAAGGYFGIRKLIEVISELKKGNTEVLGPLQRFLPQLKTLISSVTKSVSSLTDKLKGLKSLSLPQILDNIKSALEKIKRTISDLFGGKSEEASDLITIADEKVPLAGKKINKFAEILQSACEKMHKFFERLPMEKVAALAFTVTMTYVGVQLAKTMANFGKTSRSFGSLADQMGKTLKQIREGGLKSLINGTGELQKKKKAITTAILEIAGAIGILAASLKLLSTVPVTEIWTYVGALGALSGVLTTMTLLMALASKLAGGAANLAKASFSMVALSGSIILLVGALKLLETVEMEGIWQRLGYLAAVAGIMTAAATIISRFGTVAGDKKLMMGAVSILACGFAIKKVAEALSIISDIELTKLSWEKMGYFAATVGMLGVLAVACSKISMGGFFGLLGCLIILKAATPIMEQIASYNYEDMANTFKKALVTIGVLGLVIGTAAVIGIAAAGKGVKAFGAGLLGIAASMTIMGVVVWRMGQLDKNTLIKGTLFMAAFMVLVDMLAVASECVKDSKMAGFGVGLLAMATSMAIMAVVAWRIGQLDKNTLIKGTAFVVALLGMIALLEIASKATANAKVGPLITLLLMMTTMMSMMIVMTLMDVPGLLASTVAICAVLLALGEAIKSIARINSKGAIAKIGVLLVATGAMVVLGESIRRLSSLPWQSIAASGGAMLLAMLGLSKVLLTLSSTRGFTAKSIGPKLLALVGASASLILIGAALRVAVVDQPWEAIAASGAAMAIALIAVAAALRIISGIKDVDASTIAAFAAVATALIPVAIALKLAVSDSPWESIIASGAAMSLALISVAGALRVIAGIQNEISVNTLMSFWMVATALIPIALALKIAVSDQPWQTMIAGALAMSTCLLAVAGALGIVSKMDGTIGGALTLVVASAALIEMAYALDICNGVDWASVGQMSTMLLVLVGALTALGFFGMTLAPGMLAASVAMIAASGAILLLAAALQVAAGVDQGAVNALCVTLTVMSLALIGLAAAFTIFAPGAALVIPVLATLTTVILAISAAFLAFGAATLMTAGAFTIITNAVNSMNAANMDKVAEDMGKLALALAGMSVQCLTLPLAAGGLALLALSIVQLQKSVTAATAEAVSNLDKLQTAVTDELTEASEQTVQIGKQAVEGFIKGLTDKTEIANVKLAAANLGNALADQLRTTLDIHSPSRVMDLIGEFAVKGFRDGVLDKKIWGEIKTEVSNDVKTLTDRFGAGVDAVKGFMAGIKEGNSVLASTKSYYSEFSKSVGATTKETDYLSAAEDKLNELIEGNTDGLGDYDKMLEQTTGATDGLGKSTGKAADEFEKLRSTIESAIDPFKAFDFGGDDAISSWQILENMQSQIQGVSQWAQMLAELGSRGLSSQLLSYLSQLGPQGYQYVQAFYSMTSEQLAMANDRYSQILSLDENATATIKQGYKDAGYWSAAGFGNGITSGAVEAIRAAGDMGFATLDRVKEVLGIHSPSREMHTVGEFMMMGMKNGLRDTKLVVFAQLGIIGSTSIRTISNIMNRDSGFEIGQNFTLGLAGGIEANVSAVVTAASVVAGAAVIAAKEALKVESPSKVMKKVGGFFTEGFAIGIENNSDMVESSSTEIANSAIATASEAVKRMLAIINEPGNFDPTIRPVLDLSNIQNGASDISRMLDSSGYAVQMSGGIHRSLNLSALNASMSGNATIKTDNTDVVTAIRGLQSDMQIMAQQMSNMKIMLDGTTLVGGIVDQMDTALGQRAIYAGRGN